MAGKTGTRMYTPEQKDWMTDKVKSSRYQSKNGRLRAEKILSSYNKKFGEYRPIDGFGTMLRKLRRKEVPSRPTRSYKKRAVAEVKHEHVNHMTLEQMEAKLKPMVSMIETIKSFMS